MSRRFHCMLVLAFSVPMLAGCSGDKKPPSATVTGTVKYKGKVVEGAVVTFIVDGHLAANSTDKEGKFKILNVPIGKAKVTIVKNTPTGGGKGTYDPSDPSKSTQGGMAPNMPSAKNELPPKYADKDLSGLEKDVSEDESANDFTFELT